MALTFHMTGSYNDVNVLQCSAIFFRLAEDNALVVRYEFNGHKYNSRYYLVDGIYAGWTTLLKTILEPTEEQNKRFIKQQEAL
jgi:hypothetical protein